CLYLPIHYTHVSWCPCSLFFYGSDDLRDLHSFPTRRSSDLKDGISLEYKKYEHNAQAAALVGSHYDTPPLAYVHSYGCQQNVNDGERIKGVLVDIGYGLCDNPEDADLILFNTCAVREHAEQRVFGNVGALKGLKEKKPGLIIGLCGCMANQKQVVEKLRRSYPYVDLVFGVDGIDTLPGLLARKLEQRGRILLEPAQRP